MCCWLLCCLSHVSVSPLPTPCGAWSGILTESHHCEQSRTRKEGSISMVSCLSFLSHKALSVPTKSFREGSCLLTAGEKSPGVGGSSYPFRCSWDGALRIMGAHTLLSCTPATGSCQEPASLGRLQWCRRREKQISESKPSLTTESLRLARDPVSKIK